MMRWIVGSSLRFRYLVIALGVGMMYFGVLRLRDLPVDVFPEFAPARVEIQTICLGLSPAEVEALVTVPLENAVNGVPGVEFLRSKSVPQLSSVTAIFKPGVDEMKARQLVTERVAIATATLPTWAAPPCHNAAPVLDQPGHEDRHHLREQVRHGPFHARLLDHQGPPARRARRRQRRRSGASS